MQRRICEALAIVAIAVIALAGPGLTGTSGAQNEIGSDISGVGYWAIPQPGNPDNTLRLINPTTQPLSEGGLLCAMIYVFDAHEELQECCGCRVTNNGLRTISVTNDLTKNFLSGVFSNPGGLEVVSALPNATGGGLPACNPARSYSTQETLRGYISHSVFLTGGGEVPLVDGNLGSGEISNLQSLCAFIHTNGTGRGICTCGVGDEIAPQPGAGGR